MQSRAKQQHTASGKFLSYIKLKTTACHHAFFIQPRQKLNQSTTTKKLKEKEAKKTAESGQKRGEKSVLLPRKKHTKKGEKKTKNNYKTTTKKHYQKHSIAGEKSVCITF